MSINPNKTTLYYVIVGYPNGKREGTTVRCQRQECRHPIEIHREQAPYDLGGICSICKRRPRK